MQEPDVFSGTTVLFLKLVFSRALTSSHGYCCCNCWGGSWRTKMQCSGCCSPRCRLMDVSRFGEVGAGGKWARIRRLWRSDTMQSQKKPL